MAHWLPFINMFLSVSLYICMLSLSLLPSIWDREKVPSKLRRLPPSMWAREKVPAKLQRGDGDWMVWKVWWLY